MDEPRERQRPGSEHTTGAGEPPGPRPVLRSPSEDVPGRTLPADDELQRAGTDAAMHEPAFLADVPGEEEESSD